jgi:hypothetical protein
LTNAAYANPFLFRGYTQHDEPGRYMAAGLTPQQALLMATVNPGRYVVLVKAAAMGLALLSMMAFPLHTGLRPDATLS